MLRNTPGVLGFLGGTDNPTPLRQSELNRMLGLDQRKKKLSPSWRRNFWQARP
jgi:transcription antitermination factor NusG